MRRVEPYRGSPDYYFKNSIGGDMVDRAVRGLLAVFMISGASSVVLAVEDEPAHIRGAEAPARISLGLPGIGIESEDRLALALPLVNVGTALARDVRILSATLTSSRKLSPTGFPVAVGDIARGRDAVFNGVFSVARLRSGTHLRLVVQGTCACAAGGRETRFTLERQIAVPMRSGQSAKLRTISVKSVFATGTPLANVPGADSAAPGTNEAKGPPIPKGVPRGTLRPTGRRTRLARVALASAGNEDRLGFLVRSAHADDDPVVFVRSTQAATANNAAVPDASGASSGNIVIHTNNGARRFSTDGGVTFTGTLSPPGNLSLDGGADGDHVVIYVPKIDRFVWVMQFNRQILAGETSKTASGPNRYRFAVASPKQVADSGGTAWSYFDLTSGLFGFGNDWMDYPDLAFGDKFLYFSADVVGVNSGRLVGRISLDALKNGGAIDVGFTNAPLQMSWGSHLAQNVAGTAYLAGHNTDSKLRIYAFPESADAYTVHDVDIDSWPQDGYVSLAPGGINWLAKGLPGAAIIGAARKSRLHCVQGKAIVADELWLAWTAGTGGAFPQPPFPQPHVQLVSVDTYSYHKLAQAQIWNDTLAFAYPALAVNARNQLGMAIAFGGDNQKVDANFGVGIYGDNTIYVPPTLGNGSIARYGDYFGLQRHSPNEGLFSAFGIYFTRNDTTKPNCGTSTAPNCTTNLSFIQFGRKSVVDNQPVAEQCTNAETCKCDQARDICVAACRVTDEACKKRKPGNPLPKDCAKEYKACQVECAGMLKLCLGKCAG